MIRTLTCLLLFYSFITNAQNYNACVQNTPIHVVVLGSSTAAGSGPSSSDSTWVNRYRKHLQSLNSQNTVTNLAIGGTTTYHIMPDWFSASNRPSRNTNNNISQAVRLGADAVIVNMPSNDASNGFTAQEQMQNFRILKNVADSFNIKIWICTTQPRNFSLAKKQIQLDVKDSVLSVFGQFAIDFWNGFADTSNGLKTIYDSGDGVHMNDLGHRLLYNLVVNELIPNELVDTLAYPEFSLNIDHPFATCGDSLETLSIRITNLGPNTTAAITSKMNVISSKLGNSLLYNLPILNGLNSCTTDTINFVLNTSLGGNFIVKTYLDSIDSIPQNDTSYLQFLRNQKPIINAQNVYYCPNDSAYLNATSIAADTILWFNSLTSSQILFAGSNYPTLPLNNGQDYYAQAISGPFHFTESFDLSNTTTTNWNGYMFDIISSDSISIDSISFPINSIGSQIVHAYYRYGSHDSAKTNANIWTYWGADSISVTQSGDLTSLKYSPIDLINGDTLAIYFHLQNPNARLSYRNASSPSIASDSKISIPSGSGISNTFGTSYYPRNFCGIVHYHHGYNPFGKCRSNRIKVSAIKSLPYLSLGNDTTIHLGDSLEIAINGFSNYLWNTGDTSAQITVYANNLGIGIHSISLEAEDSLLCSNRDTLTISVQLASGIENHSLNDLSISPNPSNGLINLSGVPHSVSQIKLYNLDGQLVWESVKKETRLNFLQLEKGLYFLHFIGNQINDTRKIVLF